jgi:hypothetical protein
MLIYGLYYTDTHVTLNQSNTPLKSWRVCDNQQETVGDEAVYTLTPRWICPQYCLA